MFCRVQDEALLSVGIHAGCQIMLFLGAVQQVVVVLAVSDAGDAEDSSHQWGETQEGAASHGIGKQLAQVPWDILGTQGFLDIVGQDIIAVELCPLYLVLVTLFRFCHGLMLGGIAAVGIARLFVGFLARHGDGFVVQLVVEVLLAAFHA